MDMDMDMDHVQYMDMQQAARTWNTDINRQRQATIIGVWGIKGVTEMRN